MGTTGQSITLANSIIGVGILAMPFCFQQCGVLLATLILLSMGLVSRLCCYFLLKSALLARRRNFEFLAFHVFGPTGKFAVEVCIIGFLMGTCIAYFVVVGDLGPQIIAKLLNINQSDILRTSIMVLVSLLCVLPMGLLRNVDSLSNVSAATIGFYFCLVMKVITEAASQLLTGEWHTKMEMWKPSGVLQCVPIFSMALFCQTQLFEIFESIPTLSLEKMNVVAKNAINICTGVYFTLGVFGYIAFCSQQISGNILMSLSPTLASDVIKLGFVMSLAFSFPLIIFPCRASLYSLLYKKVHSSHHDHIINNSIPESSFRCITVAIIAVTLFISLLIPNIELVLGLVGSTIGVLICIVFPAACFINVTFKNTNERVFAKVILALGLIIMILGTYANLQAAESQKDKYDVRYITQEKIDKMVEDFFEKMEKSDDVKPIPKNDPRSNEIKGNENVPIESEVQPPNPVPPEAQSNEKPQKQKESNVDSKLKEVLPAPEKDALDKVSETHPKNLNKLNEVKVNNAESNIEKDKIENQKEEKAKTASNEEEMKKQQQLIETIKQHGEEQKELIKEQKEILDEIMKTKQEQQNENKNEADSLAAKRIAVESIKKIADMAIQSLSGVSEKPAGQDVEDKKVEHIEELADKAVLEIAQKAAETIEAINEINGKADAPVPKPDNQNDDAEIKPNVQSSNSNINPSVQNVDNNLPGGNKVQSVNNNDQPQSPSLQNVQQPVHNVQQEPMNVHQLPASVQQPAQNVQQPAANLQQSAANVQQSAAYVQQSATNVQQSAANVQQPATNVQQPAVNAHQPAANVQQPPASIQQPVANIQQPAASVQQPAASVQQSATNIQKPSASVQQPAANVQQPAASVQQPVANIQQPAASVQQPAANVQQPAASVQQPAASVQQSATNIQKPSASVQQPAANVQQPAASVQQPVANVQQPAASVQQPFANIQQPAASVQKPAANVQQSAASVQQLAANVQQPAVNVQQLHSNGQQPALNGQQPNVQQPVNAQQPSENVEQPFVNANVNQANLAQNKQYDVQNLPSDNIASQSYNNGEGKINRPVVQVNDMINNIPLPLSKEHSNKNQQNGNAAVQEPPKLNNINNNPNNGAIDNSKHNEVLNRQKREVVDCTEKTTLKPEDKQICEKLVNVPQVKTDVKDDFPKIDLNDVVLPKSLPLDVDLIHHLRSLKSYDVEDKDR